jgi:predicted DNA-binding ribbon-helix-helix protein
MGQPKPFKKSAVVKHSIFVNGRKTSVSLENDFWHGLHEIADHERTTIPTLVGRIDVARDICNLSSAIRSFVFNHFRRNAVAVIDTRPSQKSANDPKRIESN